MELWLEKRNHPKAHWKWLYRLPFEFVERGWMGEELGRTDWVCVSWGRDNDTQIFPAPRDDFRVRDYAGLVEFALWGFWKDPDEAMTAYLTDPSVRNPYTDHPEELTGFRKEK